MPAPCASPSTGVGAHGPSVPMDRCWTVPLLAACATFLFVMPEANSGLSYVLFMDKFDVNRKAASWPRTTYTVVSSLMGFIIGAVQERVSIYSMMMTGAFLCPAAIIASAFVPSIQWMMFTFGVFYGISQGTLFITTSVYTVLHFHKYRSASMGLKYMGVSISGIVGPLLLSTLEQEYGLEGTFILLGGLTLNLIPLAVLLRNPRPTKLPLRSFCKNCSQNDKRAQEPALTERPSTHRLKEAGKEQRLPVDQHECSLYTITQSTTNMKEVLENSRPVSLPPGCAKNGANAQGVYKNSSNVFMEAANIMRDPVFYTLLGPFVATDFTLPLFYTTVVDYAADKGVSQGAAAMLVTCLSVGGCFGRIVGPVLSDKLPHGRCVVASVSFLLVSVCFLLMPHLHSFPAIAVITVVFGAQQGHLATIKTVLSADYLGANSVPISLGLVALVSLPLTFCEPSILGSHCGARPFGAGLFRDTRGSYDNLYRMCSGIDLLAAFLLLVNACIEASRGTKARIN